MIDDVRIEGRYDSDRQLRQGATMTEPDDPVADLFVELDADLGVAGEQTFDEWLAVGVTAERDALAAAIRRHMTAHCPSHPDGDTWACCNDDQALWAALDPDSTVYAYEAGPTDGRAEGAGGPG